MDLDTLLASPPRLHLLADGTPVPLEVSEEVLRTIDRIAGPDTRSLETGAGLSTVMFALKGGQHTTVVPWATEIERIKGWCAENEISTDRITFHQSPSEDILPSLEPEPLDLVLIDGAHGFPSPFIDWYYAGRRLRRGGTLIVDDTNIWTGRVLHQFLAAEPGWEVERTFPMRAAVLKRTAEPGPLPDWVHQPYVTRRSWNGGLRGATRKAVKGAEMVRRGELGRLARRARRG
jgi:predicted O-methyltransferase YrrM